MNVNRIIGIATTLTLLAALLINAFHMHETEFNDAPSIAEFELECATCEQAPPTAYDIDLTPLFAEIELEIETVRTESSNASERRPIDVLELAPKTSPPHVQNRTRL